MMKSYNLLISLLFFSILSVAQEPVEFYLTDNQNLDEVVVTATRTPKLLKDVPIVTRVITAEEIKRTDATNMQDLIQQELPGAEFSYTMGSQPSLKFQGFDGKDVLFLVDGERLAGETLDNVDFTRLNMDDVERIEIVKGAASSLYGSNAVGGVINIITKKPTKPWAINVNGKWGKHNEQRYGGTAAFKINRFTTSTNVQKTSCDPVNFSTNSAYKFYGYDCWNIKEKMSFHFNEVFDLSGHAGFFKRSRDYSESQDNLYRDFNGGLKAQFKFNDRNLWELSYLYDQYDKSDFYNSRYDILDYRNVQHTFRTLYTHRFSKGITLIGGGDFMRDYLKTYQFADTAGKHQFNADLFSQADWNINSHWNLIGGVRYDYFSSADISHVTGKLGAMYKIRDEWRFRGSYAGGFRAPTLKESEQEFLMGGFMYIYGNKNLRPESSNNFQLSSEYTHGVLDVTLSGFCNLFDNRISTRYDSLYYQGKPILKAWRDQYTSDELDLICDKKDAYAIYENREKLAVTGVNTDVKLRFPFGLKTTLSYVYTHESSVNSASTRPHAATLKTEYHKDWKKYGFNVGLSGRYMSKLTTDDSEYEGYMIWKLSLMQTILKGIYVNFVVDNLFNYIPSSYNSTAPGTTGTSLSVSLSVDIDKLVPEKKKEEDNDKEYDTKE